MVGPEVEVEVEAEAEADAGILVVVAAGGLSFILSAMVVLDAPSLLSSATGVIFIPAGACPVPSILVLVFVDVPEEDGRGAAGICAP